ncbi:glycosyltransferase family 4 protein [Natronolimnobius sp. AArcel1]|uniref:glycosyltransferase family 4 protein n=1 Tax=Natronolimnobius sp. AArcel1 TaxID=1679093 RepID=UPI0013EB6084|nr:glycosyltransferase family 4 protein [Natronolimnobius sp. AArcel1]NGM71405.1 glycosyltransferase family 4 protein [Natronolimnobius sp. AArcel1]
MRIAMIQDDWWPRTGGGPVHVKELSVALAEQYDHTIDIYTRALEKDGETHTDTETFVGGAVRVHRLKPSREYWNPIGRVSSLVTPIPHLVTEDFDVVHGHTFLPAVPTRTAGALTDASTVFTVHGTALTSGVGRDESMLAHVKRRLERQFVLNFDYDHVISVNTEHLDLLGEHHLNLSCVPNGVNLERFNVDVDRRDEILFLGRLAPKKRVSDLIEAFNRIADEIPETDLVIVGTGPKSDELKAQASRYGLDGRVHFEGRVSDEAIPRYYRRARLFVLPSVWEGHPLTLLEAWAGEVPVITSEVEGIAEFVDHKETGYLVPPESPDELADAIQYALSNPNESQRWASNAYDLVREEYSWEGVADRTNRIYEQITSP